MFKTQVVLVYYNKEKQKDRASSWRGQSVLVTLSGNALKISAEQWLSFLPVCNGKTDNRKSSAQTVPDY